MTMPHEIALLNNYLIVGAVLFAVGAVGFVARRNMIVMFLSAEIMLQGVSLSLVAWSRFRNDWGGQMLVLFIIAVAACEAAIALGLIVALFHRRRQLDVALWQSLRESNQPEFLEAPLPPEPAEPTTSWPQLPRAGLQPPSRPEDTEYREKL